MRDLTLKFKDAAEMTAVFEPLGWEEGGFSEGDVHADVIGVHYENVGTEEEPLFKRKEGYLVNLRVMDDTDITSLEPYFVEVKTPVRVWA